MKFLALVSIVALLTSGCVEGSATVERVCSYEELSQVSSVAAGRSGTVKYLSKPNFGDAISELDDFGNVDLTLKYVVFSTKEKIDLSFVRAASISYVREDESEITLAETEEVRGDRVVMVFKNVPPEVTEAAKKDTLRLRTRATGTMPYGSVTPTISICASGHVEGRATLSDL
jgi:hypothetical protein